MQTYKYSDPKIKEIISSCLAGSGLIPILGAGFSVGSEAKNGKVPDGNTLAGMMINTIKRAAKIKPGKIEEIKKLDFNDIAEYYIDERNVPREMFIEEIRNHFTQVNIRGVRKIFLQQNWKYIYTLNIDDGIERANNTLTKVLPYRHLDKKAQDINLVYKIHGCANEETLYKEDSKIIFSEAQYIRSLTKNEHILTALSNDVIESNLIFIGCSLRKEVDLMYAIAGVTEEKLVTSKRIYVTKDELTETEKDRLERYGINTICKLDDYDDIYYLINECFAMAKGEKNDSLLEFSSDKIKHQEEDKNKCISFMIQNEGDGQDKFLTLPYHSIERNVSQQILKGITNNTVVIIKGRRFSGKSLLLKTLSLKLKSKKTFYIPSIISLNIDDIKRMCTIKNSTYFIDSNVITYQEAAEIRNQEEDLIKNDISFVIACNSTESDITNTFLTPDHDENFFELNNKLNGNELLKLNIKLSELGIIEWKKDINILENTFKTANQYPQISQKILIQNDVNETDLKLLILLCVLDKVYISLSREINIGNKEAQIFSSKFSPAIELIPTNELEKHQKSRFKIVSNSRSWLLNIVSEQYHRYGSNSLNNIVINMIKHFLRNKQFEDVGKKLIMFDTVNQLFGRKKGAGRLLLKLYEDLQPLLNHEADYWLQRAKGMGKVLNDPHKLRDAIDFAKKAFEDGKRGKTVVNAEFTLANLHGKICELTDYKDIKLVNDALYWYSSAIRNNSYNQKYINSMLEITKGGKGNLYSLCHNILSKGIKLMPEENRMFNEIQRFIPKK